ncbi:MAG: AMP-binding protein [Bacteroidaceae bacterium]|nr:AMP-binding protein [Bacteroidaceae bacterium]
MAERTFFITGGTGLLGTEIVHQLLMTSDSLIRVLVRAASETEAVNRLYALWWEDDVLANAIGLRVQPVVGDIMEDGLALNDEERTTLVAETTYVIHCAAETGIQKSKDDLWRMNVIGTDHMVKLSEQMPYLKCFTYISTAYVAGTRSGLIMEDYHPISSYYSLYEQSKAEAERVVRATSLPLIVCRPGMIVGNCQTGRTRNFNTVYYVLKQMLQGKLRCLPVSRTQTVNVVPVDYVAKQVVALTLSPLAIGKTFHLTAPFNQLPQVGELVQAVRVWALEHLQINLPVPFFLPLPFLCAIGRRYNSGTDAKRHSLLSNFVALMPYFFDNHVFDRTNTDQLTGTYCLNWREFLPIMLDFACRHNFMRLSDKSIFEQAVIRRESRHYPITYYNISARGTEKVIGKQMNNLVHHFVGKLTELGVKQGKTVALSGINCTEHAALDNAIGLLGAVSVPIYYTTPTNEIALLLKKSGARWFFVGDERVWNSLKANLSFSGHSSWDGGVFSFTIDNDHDVQVVLFAGLGKGNPSASLQRNSPIPALGAGHLATIRYTSGTTGEPKGVMFNFNQLKWMGEVLTNLLSWHDRNHEMRYLSFLPMSHVVEGILAAYAPYCMLCKAKIYYLNDFQMLTKALPEVRPTVFFSVPRFYEKLWEQIEQNPLGRKYLRMPDSRMKKFLGGFLRRIVLRKAGLDQCSQLLVGSAPISEELLLRFRGLGIEIHNAYGQTEAPLITLNRLGDNVIPSIGTPLPDTSVSVRPDGELVVRGPQVALGYYKLESDTFQNGELHTGDLGSVGSDGHIYIRGRKKDMLITSYGKNINCTKIEQRLMDIPCVDQAVLVGEKRPYCAALLWTTGSTDSMQHDIEKMNQSLSHPEQVKRWRIIKTPLSIKNGELTPNLKVKRNIVLEHYECEINAMYAN